MDCQESQNSELAMNSFEVKILTQSEKNKIINIWVRGPKIHFDLWDFYFIKELVNRS
jgi:hypothetical protein